MQRLLPASAIGLLLLTLIPDTQLIFRVTWAGCLLFALYFACFPKRDLSWLVLPPIQKLPKYTWRNYTYPLAGFAIVIATLTALEIRQHYYFVQDDTHTQYLPVMVEAMRHFFTEWRLPMWNAYVGFGMSLTSGGWCMLYPVLYVSYLIANLFGDEYMMIDVLAYIHWAAGYAVLVIVLMRLGVRAPLAAALGVAYVLSGYFLLVGRSWHSVIMAVPWLPMLMLSLVRFIELPKPTWRWAAWSGLVIGFYALTDHMQYWIYAISVYGLGLFLACFASREEWFQRMRVAAAAVLWGAAIACPIVVIQYLELPPLALNSYGDSLLSFIHAMILPWPFIFVTYGDATVVGGYNMTPTLFFGGFSMVAAMVMAPLLLVALLRGNGKKRSPLLAVFIAMALLALFWSFGDRGGIWSWLSRVWPFDKFNSPHKLMPIVITTVSVTGGVMLELALRRFRFAWLTPVLALLITSAAMWNAWNCRDSRYTFGERPYPSLPSYMYPLNSPVQEKGRLRTLAVGGTHNPTYPFTLRLVNNHASAYQIISANRYAQRVTTLPPEWIMRAHSANEPEEFLRRHGIGHLWVSASKPSDWLFAHNLDFNVADYLRTHPDLVNSVEHFGDHSLIRVAEKETDPLVFFSNAPERGLPFTVHGDGLSTEITRPGLLIVNFLHHPWMKAYAGDRELRMQFDKFYRMLVIVPADVRGTIDIRFSPPWYKALLVSLGLFLLGLVPLLSAFFQKPDVSPTR